MCAGANKMAVRVMPGTGSIEFYVDRNRTHICPQALAAKNRPGNSGFVPPAFRRSFTIDSSPGARMPGSFHPGHFARVISSAFRDVPRSRWMTTVVFLRRIDCSSSSRSLFPMPALPYTAYNNAQIQGILDNHPIQRDQN